MSNTLSQQQIANSGFQSLEDLNDYLQKTSAQIRELLGQSQWAEAEKWIHKVLAILPEHLAALSDLADVKRKLGDFDKAYEISLGVLKLDKNYTKILDSLTTTCYHMKRFEEAKYYAKRSIRIKQKESERENPTLQPLPEKAPPGLSKDKTRNIISYSLFGDLPRYCECAILNTKLAKKVYPEWTCRFYVDDSVPKHVIQRLIHLGAQINMVNGEKTKNAGLFWRFLVMDDPNVDCFIIRDADSLLSCKEKAAVDEWLASGRWFHIMRDAIEHSELILAGMWGGYTGAFPNIKKSIEQHLQKLEIRGRTIDQVFLREEIYPSIAQSVLVHDNYNLDGNSHNFPDYPLSEIEKIPYFHIGMIDAGALHTSIKIDDKQAEKVRWFLKDENEETVCSYDIAVTDANHVELTLPYFYSLKIQQKRWHIHTTTLV